MKKWGLFAVSAMLFASLSAGCEQDATPEHQSVGSNQSIQSDVINVEQDGQGIDLSEGTSANNLSLYSWGAGINDEQDLNNIIVKPVQQAHPDIRIELMKDITFDEMIVSGQIPDLIATSNFYLHDILNLGLNSDLSGLVAEHNIDISKIEPAAMSVMEQFSNDGELAGIPYSLNYGVLLYNKQIFEKFNVDEPVDNMYWDDVIQLARRVTKMHEEQQYIGLDIGPIEQLVRHRSLQVTDLQSKEAVIHTSPMQEVFELYQSIYSIPGAVTAEGNYQYGLDFFLNEQRLAMVTAWIAAVESKADEMAQANLDWDIVSYPQSEGRDGLGRETDFHLFVVPPDRGEKTEAIHKVIETVVSETAQRSMNRSSRLTILADPQLRAAYASDSKVFQDKNLAGIYNVQPALAPVATKYDSEIYAVLREAARKVIVDSMEIEEALSKAQLEAEQVIRELDGAS